VSPHCTPWWCLCWCPLSAPLPLTACLQTCLRSLHCAGEVAPSGSHSLLGHLPPGASLLLQGSTCERREYLCPAQLPSVASLEGAGEPFTAATERGVRGHTRGSSTHRGLLSLQRTTQRSCRSLVRQAVRPRRLPSLRGAGPRESFLRRWAGPLRRSPCPFTHTSRPPSGRRR